MTAFGVFLVHIFPYSVQLRENADQKTSEYGHFSCSAKQWFYSFGIKTIKKFLNAVNDYEKTIPLSFIFSCKIWIACCTQEAFKGLEKLLMVRELEDYQKLLGAQRLVDGSSWNNKCWECFGPRIHCTVL